MAACYLIGGGVFALVGLRIGTSSTRTRIGTRARVGTSTSTSTRVGTVLVLLERFTRTARYGGESLCSASLLGGRGIARRFSYGTSIRTVVHKNSSMSCIPFLTYARSACNIVLLSTQYFRKEVRSICSF